MSSDHLKLEEAAVSYENLYHINSIKRRRKTKQKRVSCELVIFFLVILEKPLYFCDWERRLFQGGLNL